MTISITEASQDDVDRVVELWRVCGLTRPWNDPYADFSLALKSDAATIFLAKEDGSLVGTVMAGFDGHRGWIYYLGTAPDVQKHGIARALLAAAERWLKGLDCPKVELMVRNGNPAVGLYEHLGWELQPVAVYARWLNENAE